MANYYCLMAGAPELALTDAKPQVSVVEFREQASMELSSLDARILEQYFFLEEDCRNLVRLLKNPDAELLPGGNYSREQFEDLMKSAREINFNVHRYPAFMSEYARQWTYNKDVEGYFPEDEIIYQFYNYVICNCRNVFVRRWYKLNLDINNILTAVLARQQGWSVGDFIKGDNEVTEMIRENKTRDFDLSHEFDYVKDLMKIVDEPDPVDKERMIDSMKWLWLDEYTFFDPFNFEALFAYFCKLKIKERWARLDVEQGKATFENIIENLRGEARVPAEFKLNNDK